MSYDYGGHSNVNFFFCAIARHLVKAHNVMMMEMVMTVLMMTMEIFMTMITMLMMSISRAQVIIIVRHLFKEDNLCHMMIIWWWCDDDGDEDDDNDDGDCDGDGDDVVPM